MTGYKNIMHIFCASIAALVLIFVIDLIVDFVALLEKMNAVV